MMDPTIKVRSQRKEATRDQLLTAATDLLAQHGYAALRMAAVAKTARVSPGGLLHHFPTKESLVIAVLERLSEHVLEVAREDAARESIDCDILARVAESADRFYAAPEFLIYLDIFLSARRGTPIGEAASQLLLAQRAATETLWLPALIERGITPDLARSVVRALWALSRGLAISSAPRGEATMDKQATDIVLSALRLRVLNADSDSTASGD